MLLHLDVCLDLSIDIVPRLGPHKKQQGQFHEPNFFGPNTLMSKARGNTIEYYGDISFWYILRGIFCD